MSESNVQKSVPQIKSKFNQVINNESNESRDVDANQLGMNLNFPPV